MNIASLELVFISSFHSDQRTPFEPDTIPLQVSSQQMLVQLMLRKNWQKKWSHKDSSLGIAGYLTRELVARRQRSKQLHGGMKVPTFFLTLGELAILNYFFWDNRYSHILKNCNFCYGSLFLIFQCRSINVCAWQWLPKVQIYQTSKLSSMCPSTPVKVPL